MTEETDKFLDDDKELMALDSLTKQYDLEVDLAPWSKSYMYCPDLLLDEEF